MEPLVVHISLALDPNILEIFDIGDSKGVGLEMNTYIMSSIMIIIHARENIQWNQSRYHR
jgi:hypothetical protein